MRVKRIASGSRYEIKAFKDNAIHFVTVSKLFMELRPHLYWKLKSVRI